MDVENQDFIEIPVFSVEYEDLCLIKEYCEHFDYSKSIDDIPVPLPKGGYLSWLKDPWEAGFI